jgi:hypothetical protein
VLYRAPVVDRQTLCLSRPWAEFLAALVARAGGSGEQPTNADLAGLLAALAATVAALPPPARTHLLGGPLTPPRVVAVAAGAGAGATASVAGTDTAGYLELTTASGQARRSQSEVLRVTFATAYSTPPVVVICPANDAAWSLLFGRFLPQGHAASVRLRREDVSTTGFPLRVGVTSLPREAETYAWSYLVMG